MQQDEFGGQRRYEGDPVENGGLEEVRMALKDVGTSGRGLLVFGKVPTWNPIRIRQGSFHGKERQSACSPFDLELTQVELDWCESDLLDLVVRGVDSEFVWTVLDLPDELMTVAKAREIIAMTGIDRMNESCPVTDTKGTCWNRNQWVCSQEERGPSSLFTFFPLCGHVSK